MLHTCVQKFDVMGKNQKILELNAPLVGAPNFLILPTATLYARMLWHLLYMNYLPKLDAFQPLKSVLSCQSLSIHAT